MAHDPEHFVTEICLCHCEVCVDGDGRCTCPDCGCEGSDFTHLLGAAPYPEADFEVICANGCPEGAQGRHKFSCPLAAGRVQFRSGELFDLDDVAAEFGVDLSGGVDE